jgi:hypothetical protein
MHNIEDLIEYVSSYDSVFVSKIEGATQNELDEFRSLVGHPLPAFYETFLTRMGRNSDFLEIGYDGSSRIGDLIEYYKKFILTGLHPVVDNAIYISVFGQDFDVCLISDGRKDGPSVFVVEGASIHNRYADSLEALLHRKVFFEREVGSSTSIQTLWNPNPARARKLEDLAEVCAKAGMSTRWFSDRCAHCATTTRIRVGICQYASADIQILVGGESEEEMRATSQLFIDLGSFRPIRSSVEIMFPWT